MRLSSPISGVNGKSLYVAHVTHMMEFRAGSDGVANFCDAQTRYSTQSSSTQTTGSPF